MSDSDDDCQIDPWILLNDWEPGNSGEEKNTTADAGDKSTGDSAEKECPRQSDDARQADETTIGDSQDTQDLVRNTDELMMRFVRLLNELLSVRSVVERQLSAFVRASDWMYVRGGGSAALRESEMTAGSDEKETGSSSSSEKGESRSSSGSGGEETGSLSGSGGKESGSSSRSGEEETGSSSRSSEEETGSSSRSEEEETTSSTSSEEKETRPLSSSAEKETRIWSSRMEEEMRPWLKREVPERKKVNLDVCQFCNPCRGARPKTRPVFNTSRPRGHGCDELDTFEDAFGISGNPRRTVRRDEWKFDDDFVTLVNPQKPTHPNQYQSGYNLGTSSNSQSATKTHECEFEEYLGIFDNPRLVFKPKYDTSFFYTEMPDE